MTEHWWNPYLGLPPAIEALLWFLLAIVLLTFLMVLILIVQGTRELRAQRREARDGDESEFLWVFVVPALNEEVTIADSVQRLVSVEASNKVIVVVDDGSDDATPAILSALAEQTSYLKVLRRELPNARLGKAAGLDDAWSFIHASVLADPRYAGWPTERVIVGVVDADGRLDPRAPVVVAGVLKDARVGGVQCMVRIYNRGTYLTWAQNLEFGVSAFAYQLGRSWWGTANMGGNAQFMRLAALDDVAVESGLPPQVERGPWKDRLTEDQDIGVRAVHGGWRGAQTVGTYVEQQGVVNFRRLFKQRVRWAQGSWQCLSLITSAHRARSSRLGRLDHYVYLLMPVLQLAVGIGLVLSLALWAFWGVPFHSDGWPSIVFLLALAFLPCLVALTITGKTRPTRLPRALLGVAPYVFYTWILWPTVPISLVRELRGIRGWTKTAREALGEPLPKG